MKLLAGLATLIAASLLVPSCATTGAEGEGDRGLPTVGVGPFRKLGINEVPGIAPFVLDDRIALYREPSVLAGEGDSVILYAVAKQATGDVIVRSRADDGRAFFGTSGDFGKTPPVVLAPDQIWEGKFLSGPFALRVNDEILLYYSGEGGIGLARSSDGLVFRKQINAVFFRDPASSWETSEVRAPTVYILPDGRLRMFYESGNSIGEAESIDGVHFTRVDPDPSTPAIEPVLGPAPPAPPGSLLPNEKPPFDTARVGDPCAVLRKTPAGRQHVRVLYTGADESGASAIGFAARYGETGPLVRQAAPVYSVGAKESAPALLEVASGSYLYVHQGRRVDEKLTYPAIAAAFAPGSVELPIPLAFPDTP
jgi:hypothetical protein